MDIPLPPTPPAIVALAAPDPAAPTETATPLLPAPRALDAGPTPAPFLWAAFSGPHDAPAAADVDHDGRAELLAFAGGGVWVARNEAGQRCHAGTQPVTGFLDDVRASAFGDLDGDRRADALTVRRSGRIEVALADGALGFQRKERGLSPVAGAMRAVLADADGDGIDDLYLLCGQGIVDGPVVLLGNHGRGGFEPAREIGEAPAGASVADVDGDRRADLVYARDGALRVRLGRGTAPLGPERPLLEPGAPPSNAHAASPAATTATAARDPPRGPILAAGDADGDGRTDLALPGAWLFLREDGPVLVMDPRLTPGKSAACTLADQDGDGRADLFTFTRAGWCDVVVALSRPPASLAPEAPPAARISAASDLERALARGMADTDGDLLTDLEETLVHGTDPLVRDTDQDGLLDGWEAKGAFRGVRLDLMGASPRHRDIFLELDVEKTADMARVERAREVMRRLYASAPVANPDGVSGIAMHTLVDTRIPLWETGGLSRQQHREAFMTPSRAGIFHWMHLGARGGGGQADCWSDQGSCAGVFEATLPHEFGHQLGLNHGGDVGTNGVPIYPSLMNYAYNYQLEGRLENIDYSHGALAGVTLDENALLERLAVATERLRYLGGPPFHFKVEPREEGKASWVDWNRNGREDAGPVRENLNAAAGEGYGPREILDHVAAPVKGGLEARTLEQPALVTLPAGEGLSEALALLFVPRDGGGLAFRLLEKDDVRAFGPAARVTSSALPLERLHDVTAAAEGPRALVVAGTLDAKSVLLRLERGGAAGLTLSSSIILDDAGIPAVLARGEETFLVWRRDDGGLSGRRFGAPIPATLTAAASPTGTAAASAAAPSDPRWSDPVAIDGVLSSCPAALALDAVKGHVLLVTSDPGTDRLRLSRLDPATLRVLSSEPVGGRTGGDASNQRASVVFETAPWLEPEGRVDIFVAGKFDFRDRKEGNCTHMYRCYTIGDKAWLGRDGWKCDQTWNEWTYTLSPVAAAWFQGRPWHAGRFYTFPAWDPSGLKDSIAIGTRVDGVCDTMRDHDDWSLVVRDGLVRSILHARPAAGRARD